MSHWPGVWVPLSRSQLDSSFHFIHYHEGGKGRGFYDFGNDCFVVFEGKINWKTFRCLTVALFHFFTV